MCRVLIKEVVKIKKAATGSKDGKAWSLHFFECLVSVDGSPEEAIRTVKTFEADIAEQIAKLDTGKTLEFEAKKEGNSAPFEFLIQKPKKQGAGGKGHGAWGAGQGESNRQTALRMSAEMAKMRAHIDGAAPTAKEVLSDADELLAWLEGGAK